MKIRNIQLKSIEARKYSKDTSRPKKVRIDHNSNIGQISSKGKNRALINFEYTTSYGPIGLIKLEGALIYEDENVKEIIEAWKESRNMPNDIANKLHTAIMHACVPQAVGIAKDLKLPPPIPLPQVKLGSDAKKGKSQSGPEIA
ncbi:MAG: hypothetical protein V5A68_02055 [Candidatus Thermoplasmatota archaeon]